MVVHKFLLPDVTEGDVIHDLIASFMKLMAQSKSTIAMAARKIVMTLIILNVERMSLSQEIHGSNLYMICCFSFDSKQIVVCVWPYVPLAKVTNIRGVAQY